MKKALSLFMAIVMLISITAGMDMTASALTSGDFEYNVIDDDTAEITRYRGSATDVTIPSVIDGYTVTSIGSYAFSNCSSLTSVTIPNSVTSIGDKAFYYCSSLSEIIVDGNNQNYASQDGVLFNKDKTALIQYPIGNTRTSFTIPNSVTSIGYCAFSDCSSLTDVYYSGTQQEWNSISIGYNNESLTNATIHCTDGTINDKCLAFGHIFTNYVSNDNATCTSNATETATCDRADCGATDTREIPNSALNHDWAAATCTAPKTCNRCDVTDGEALGHDWTAATCTAPKTCNTCGTTEGEALGHIFTNYESNDDATCTSNATETAICDRADCGVTDTREIPYSALGHSYVPTVVPANCTTQGYTTYTCSVCGDSYNSDFKDALGHSFGTNNQACSVCGASNPNYVAQTQPTTQATTTQAPTTTQTQETTTAKSEAASTTAAEKESVTEKPVAPTISKLTKGKKSFKATWKKITGVSGYQVQYSTDKKFKKNTKTVTIKKNTTSTTVKKLKANKKYCVRVRSYKNAKVGGKTVKVYSSWSKVKSVKTK